MRLHSCLSRYGRTFLPSFAVFRSLKVFGQLYGCLGFVLETHNSGPVVVKKSSIRMHMDGHPATPTTWNIGHMMLKYVKVQNPTARCGKCSCGSSNSSLA